MSLALGALDGRVELKGILGEGGMGQVHRAWDRSLERAVAVKFVRGADERDAERLLLEARLQARVEHPHVVKVHEVGTLGGRPCIVMQLVEGRSLAELAPRLAPAATVELLRQAALGLHAAHLQGLVHRDVKPGNVLVDEGGAAPVALVTDFGLARGEDGGLTRTGLPMGTLDYMSPEQLAAPGPVDFRSDVYALGATLYAALAGKPPHRVLAGADGEVDSTRLLRRILEEDPPPLHAVAAGVARELSLVAGKALEKEAAARYPSALAFAEDLERFQRGEPLRARPATLGERAWKWARRNRLAARALAAAAASLLLGGGLSLWTSRQAGLEALEAARLGALAESMEAALRMEHLSPPHDLRPALARVRAEVEALRAAPGRRSGAAEHALGTGLALLGDLDGARAAHERAWALGFRTPRAAEALGSVLGRLYQRERERARQGLKGEAREKRLEEIRSALREPALRYLSQADAAGGRGASLRAFIALIEGDFAAARERAEEALAADPGRYEARRLQGEAWLRQGDRALDEQKLDDAAEAGRRAVAALEGALEWGRSDPEVMAAIAEGYQLQAIGVVRRGRPGRDGFRRSLEWLERASALDPDAPGPILVRAETLAQWASETDDKAEPSPLALYEEASGLLRRAMEKAPGDLRPRLRLVNVAYLRSFRLRLQGRPSMEVVRQGLEVLAEATALAPEDPAVRYAGMLIRSEEAGILQLEGKDTGPALRQVVRLGEEALQRGAENPTAVRGLMGESLVLLGRNAWLSGEDPRPDLTRGVELSEQARSEAKGHARRVAHLLFALGTQADLLLAMGADPAAPLARALAAADEGLAASPGHTVITANRGEILIMEARRRTAGGEDPRRLLAEADALLLSLAERIGGRSALREALAAIPLVETEWRLGRGEDPAPLVRRARDDYQALAAAQPRNATAHAGLAACALQQARWLRRGGGPAAAEARRGLSHLARALEIEGRDPQTWVTRARLEALAGDREAARKSLDTAWRRNPLVRGSPESKAAEAALRE